MDLRVSDLQNMLNVSRKTLYRWIQARKIPAYRISGQYRFRRDEIDRWMGSARVAAAERPAAAGEPAAGLAELLRRGGIHYRIAGGSMPEALAAALGATTLPPGTTTGELLQAVVERERLMSTGVGRGIAVPHPRHPMFVRTEDERLSLCFLEEPVDFRAPDGVPVSVLFLVLGASLKGQLRLLSLIANLCREEGFLQLLARQASRAEILAYVQGGGRRE